jgi:protoporphyrinogen oxidase
VLNLILISGVDGFFFIYYKGKIHSHPLKFIKITPTPSLVLKEYTTALAAKASTKLPKPNQKTKRQNQIKHYP